MASPVPSTAHMAALVIGPFAFSAIRALPRANTVSARRLPLALYPPRLQFVPRHAQVNNALDLLRSSPLSMVDDAGLFEASSHRPAASVETDIVGVRDASSAQLADAHASPWADDAEGDALSLGAGGAVAGSPSTPRPSRSATDRTPTAPSSAAMPVMPSADLDTPTRPAALLDAAPIASTSKLTLDAPKLSHRYSTASSSSSARSASAASHYACLRCRLATRANF